MIFDFRKNIIHIRSFTDNWGPYKFKFPANSAAEAGDGALPFGTTITTAVIRSYKQSDNSETTTDLVEAGTTVIELEAVQVRFQYPGASNSGFHYLQFDLTLSNGGKQSFVFGYLSVE